MFQYKAKEIDGSVLERGKIMEKLKKRVEKLERDNKFLNTMLIVAFIHILVIVITK